MNKDERRAYERKFAGREQQVIENPYFAPEHRESGDNPRKIKGTRNVNESAIETLYARGKLDRAQKQAADKFRRLWEACGGTIGAMDYGREPVDGGGVREALSERQVNAGRELAQCREKLGKRLFDLVCKVAGQGLSLQDISREGRARLTAADNLRDSLDDLAEMWDIVRKSSSKPAKIVRDGLTFAKRGA